MNPFIYLIKEMKEKKEQRKYIIDVNESTYDAYNLLFYLKNNGLFNKKQERILRERNPEINYDVDFLTLVMKLKEYEESIKNDNNTRLTLKK